MIVNKCNFLLQLLLNINAYFSWFYCNKWVFSSFRRGVGLRPNKCETGAGVEADTKFQPEQDSIAYIVFCKRPLINYFVLWIQQNCICNYSVNNFSIKTDYFRIQLQ